MSWSGMRGHDRVGEQLERAYLRGRLASSFLFVGPDGIGKRTFAVRFAQALLCESPSDDALRACEQCPACVQVMSGSHPDMEILEKPKNKAAIPVEMLIGDREHRMRDGLCHRIALKPFRGGRKVAIIDDADFLNQEGANCLLKTLEEPPPRSVLILLGTNEQRQLPTIRSRCQILRFSALTDSDVAAILVEQGLADETTASDLAAQADGSVGDAITLADLTTDDVRGPLLETFGQQQIGVRKAVKLVSNLVESAGKDAGARRGQLRHVIQTVVNLYRHQLRAAEGVKLRADPVLEQAVARTSSVTSQRAIRGLQRSLDALQEVDRNANQATLIECWVDDLSRIR